MYKVDDSSSDDGGVIDHFLDDMVVSTYKRKDSLQGIEKTVNQNQNVEKIQAKKKANKVLNKFQMRKGKGKKTVDALAQKAIKKEDKVQKEGGDTDRNLVQKSIHMLEQKAKEKKAKKDNLFRRLQDKSVF